MHPLLYGDVRAYRVLVPTGALVGVAAFVILARRAGLRPGRAVLFVLSLAGIGLLGGRAYTIVAEGDPSRLESWLSLLQPGYRYPGMAAAILVALPFAGRWSFPGVPLGRVADIGVPAFAFAIAVARVGCFLEGCCYGIPSGVPWAVRFPVDGLVGAHQMVYGLIPGDATATLPVHPLQLYFAALALVAGLLAVAGQRWKSYDGQILLAFVVVHETGKGLLEFLRAPDRINGGPGLGLASFALASVAIVWLLLASRGSRPRAQAV